MVRRDPEAASRKSAGGSGLDPANWLALIGAYVFLVSVTGGTLIIWWGRRSAGVPAPFGEILLWQATIYGLWIPIALAAWRLLTRFDNVRRGIVAAFLLGLVAIPFHVYCATIVDYVHSARVARIGFASAAIARLPIDILVYSAILAGLWAASAHRRTAELQSALDAARERQEARRFAEPPLLVSVGNRKVPVSLDAIEWLGAAGNYVVVNWEEREGLVRSSLQQLEGDLDGARFARIHRSTIVNLAMVASASSLADGSWKLVMRSGAELVASRTYRDIILERLGRR